MRIAVLGPLEVRRDTGDPVAVPGAKERLLLAVLAADSPGVVSTDRIVETLWNGDRPPSARGSLQVHLVHLRSALEPDRPRGSTGRYIARRGTGYSLAADREDVDALRFTDLAARGQALLAAGDAEQAARTLTAALDLWRGEPYADWPDAVFADVERRRLAEVRAGAVTALMGARLALGEDAEVVPELEQRLAGDPLQEEWWRLLVLALYRCGRQGDALAAAQRARRVLAEELGTDPGPRLRAIEAAVLAQDPALTAPVPPAPSASPSSDAPLPDVATCPYKGLATYEAADVRLFHGRGRLVTSLVARLVDAPLVVVSGPSGAGKSSVVRAGLVPALARNALPGSAGWRTVVLTPGRWPVDALVELTGETPPDAPVLLVCDQFEELWAPGVDAVERTVFLDAVLGLLDDGILVRCVAIVRGDHVGLLATHTALAERVASGVVLVPALTDDELREVVLEPAAAVGLGVEPDLVDTVVADVRGRPGALPLLSVALVGTWERRRGDRLTLAGYLGAGGVAGALTRSAEATFAALDDEGQEVARLLLVRLADTDESGALVRRPVPLAELDLDGDGGNIRRTVIDSFVARRLLTVDGERLDVAHEALLTAWPRLARWLDDDAAGRAVRRHLTPAAVDWQRGGESEEELYRGARLAAALDWAAGAAGELTTVEQRFLDASRTHADAELLAAREQTRREAAGRRRTGRLAAGLAVVLVVAVVAAGLAVRAQRTSDRAAVVADANRLAALSSSAGSADLAFLLAAQGFRLARTPQTEDGLLQALADHRRLARVVAVGAPHWGLSFADEGRALYVWGEPVFRWAAPFAVAPEAVPEPPAELLPDGLRESVVSPTGSEIAHVGATADGTWLRLVDADGGVSEVLDGADVGGEPFGAYFTSDGRRIRVFVFETADEDAASASTWRLVEVDPVAGTHRDTGITGSFPATNGEREVQISTDRSAAVFWSRGDSAFPPTRLDLDSGREVPLATPARDADILDVKAFPSGAVQEWHDGSVALYDRSGRLVQELEDLPAPVFDVTLAPDGTWGVTVGDAGTVMLWDVDPATGRWSQREPLSGQSGTSIVADIDPSGRWLATFAVDHKVVVWDLGPDGGLGRAQPGLADRWIADRPEVVEPGRLVVAPTRALGPVSVGTLPYSGPDTVGVAATFLDPRTGGVLEHVVVGDTFEDEFAPAAVSVSPDRRWVTVTSGLATTVLDARTRDAVERVELPPTGYELPDGTKPTVGVVCCAAWTHDGSRLLIATQGHGNTGGITVVDPATWEIVDEERVELPIKPEALERSADGRLLAVASGDSDEIVVLDGRTLGVHRTLNLRAGDRLTTLSFSPDGRLLAGGGEFGTLHVFDTLSWTAREPVRLGEGAMLQIEWLDDDRTAVATNEDGTVALFDTERAVVRGTPLRGAVDVGPAATYLFPDPGREIVAISERPSVLRYPTDPAVWLGEACAVAGRDLTTAEWDRYVPGRPWEPTCTDLG
jgi:DNA-binding SARP family transcriptional activator/WD40 repeat protein